MGIVCQFVPDSGTGVLLRILGWCLGVSQPMALGASLGPLEGDSAGPLGSLLHNQAISPDTGLASRLRGVSDRHFLGTGGPPGGLRLTLGILRGDVEWDWTVSTGVSVRAFIGRLGSGIKTFR